MLTAIYGGRRRKGWSDGVLECGKID